MYPPDVSPVIGSSSAMTFKREMAFRRKAAHIRLVILRISKCELPPHMFIFSLTDHVMEVGETSFISMSALSPTPLS